MAQVIWTLGALQDLNEIADYIAEHNATAANRLVWRIFERTDLLKSFPEFGRPVPEFPGSAHRQLSVAPCRVIYQLQRGAAYIEIVIRGERLLTEQMISDREI